MVHNYSQKSVSRHQKYRKEDDEGASEINNGTIKFRKVEDALRVPHTTHTF